MRRGREFDGKLLLVVGLFDFYETLLGGAAVAIAWLSSRQIRRIGLSAFDASRVKCHAFDCQIHGGVVDRIFGSWFGVDFRDGFVYIYEGKILGNCWGIFREFK